MKRCGKRLLALLIALMLIVPTLVLAEDAQPNSLPETPGEGIAVRNEADSDSIGDDADQPEDEAEGGEVLSGGDAGTGLVITSPDAPAPEEDSFLIGGEDDPPKPSPLGKVDPPQAETDEVSGDAASGTTEADEATGTSSVSADAEPASPEGKPAGDPADPQKPSPGGEGGATAPDEVSSGAEPAVDRQGNDTSSVSADAEPASPQGEASGDPDEADADPDAPQGGAAFAMATANNAMQAVPNASTDYPLWVGDVQVTSANASNILGDGTAKFEGDASGGTLTLKNAAITTKSSDGANITSMPDEGSFSLTIALEGENTLSGANYGIRRRGNLTIQSTSGGSLSIIANDTGINVAEDESELTISNCVVSAHSKRAIYAEKKLTISGAATRVTAMGTDYSIWCRNGGITLNDGLSVVSPAGAASAPYDADGHTGTRIYKDGEGQKNVIIAKPYGVSITDSTGGTVQSDKASTGAGLTVTLTVTPADGCALDTLTVSYTDANNQPQTITPIPDTVNGANTYTFTMPAADVSVSATFKETVTTYPLWVGNVQVTENNRDKLSDNHWSYDPSTHTLTLADYTYSGLGYEYTDGRYAAIYYSGSDDLTITLSGENSVTQARDWAYEQDCAIVIGSSAALTVAGTGSLDAEVSDSWGGPAILSGGAITFSGGTVKAVGGSSGIGAGQGVTVKTGAKFVSMKGNFDSAKAVDGTVKNEMPGVGFDKWYSVATKLDANTAGAALSYKQLDFPIAQYRIVFAANGGSGSMDPVSIADGDTYTLPKCGLEPPEGKKFNWWDVSGVDLIGTPGTPLLIVSNCASNGVITFTPKWIDAPRAEMTTAPTALNPTYNGAAQALVSAGAAEGGTMVYALGKDATTAPTSGWSAEIPTGVKEGTYYVWCMVQGDETHSNSAKKCVNATITGAAAPSGILIATLQSAGANALRLTWTQAANADGYDVFYKKCDGSEAGYRLAASEDAGTGSYVLTGLAKGTCYKSYVQAWVKQGGAKQVVSATPVAHAYAGGGKGKVSNPTSLTVKKTSLTVKLGKTAKIKAKVKGSTKKLLAHGGKLRYISSDPAVAKVNYKGKVKAVGAGSCTVYVLTSNGLWRAVRINVDARPTKVRLATRPKKMTVGGTLDLSGKVKLTPKKAQTTLTWSSNKPDVASVDASGKVTALAQGRATITVRAANGKKAKIRITVK